MSILSAKHQWEKKRVEDTDSQKCSLSQLIILTYSTGPPHSPDTHSALSWEYSEPFSSSQLSSPAYALKMSFSLLSSSVNQ